MEPYRHTYKLLVIINYPWGFGLYLYGVCVASYTFKFLKKKLFVGGAEFKKKDDSFIVDLICEWVVFFVKWDILEKP